MTDPKFTEQEEEFFVAGHQIIDREDLVDEQELSDEELLASAWAEYQSYKRGENK